ncbi:AraC family transcriptional regulator [Pseudodonghicola flavimaris]|uniref:AraC family transcriptional regulator n=1 Tax=Pseudodonghicola flavimaris TaxID=3050036 RepID=A0ABT7EZ18_9RHOB|nr:AraC family transcriptional regulator [Pseudodonghicola flavimaris]MDK3017591.1 AraC family transcriptional regulator [Pseudodonghicola flavimaris]
MTPGGEFMIRAGALDGFRDCGLELGADPAALLTAAGLSGAAVGTPDRLMPVQAFRRALDLAAEASGVARFGLHLSQRQSLATLGAVGYLAAHSASLRQAMRGLSRYIGLHDAALRVRVEEADGRCLWRLDQVAGAPAASVQHSDLAVGLAVKVVRDVLTPRWTPQAIHFRHSRPGDAGLYSRLFRCPVHFEAGFDGLDIACGDMDRPLATADPGLHRVLRSHLDLLLMEQRQPASSRARAVILAEMSRGAVTLEQVAHRLSMSRPSLQRALRIEGCSFQRLLDETRFAVACRYLREGERPLAQIALDLGYAEPAVFTRAFKRICGHTPSDWRRGLRQSPARGLSPASRIAGI